MTRSLKTDCGYVKLSRKWGRKDLRNLFVRVLIKWKGWALQQAESCEWPTRVDDWHDVVSVLIIIRCAHDQRAEKVTESNKYYRNKNVNNKKYM